MDVGHCEHGVLEAGSGWRGGGKGVGGDGSRGPDGGCQGQGASAGTGEKRRPDQAGACIL